MNLLELNQNQQKYKLRTILLCFLGTTLFAILFHIIYGFFGHGVHSSSLKYMFLYPLILGFLWNLAIGNILPKLRLFSGYRLYFNLFNSGIGLLLLGSTISGIFQIAGAESGYVKYYFWVGYGFLFGGLTVFIYLLLHYNKTNHS